MNYFDDIKISFVGKAITEVNNKIPTEPHHYYGIGMMLGKEYACRLLVPGNIRKIIKMPFLYLIHPAMNGAWMTVNGNMRENRWFLCEGTRGIRMVESLIEYISDYSYTIPLKNFSELIAIHQKMYHLYQNPLPAKNHHLAACAENFMSAIYDALNITEIKTPIAQAISELIQDITDEPGLDYDFKKIAEDLKISYPHFRRCFAQYTQVSIHEFLLQKRYALAVSLLKNGTESVKEIMDRCGFHTSSDFSRFIKARSGTTPSELRKQPQFTEF